jgi:ComF family protein
MFKGMLNILFPKYCPGCGDYLDASDLKLCIPCLNALPLTHFHQWNDPRFADKFYGQIPLVQGTALLHYHKKGLARKLIHQFKYHGRKDIGQWLGHWLGSELKTLETYKGLSAVVPVPMHRSKRRQRGYNQAAVFGAALAQAMDLPLWEDLLIQTKSRATQAKQGRWGRVVHEHEFHLNPNRQTAQSPQAILLVDDVVTTGATLAACGRLISRALGASLSCATIAIA